MPTKAEEFLDMVRKNYGEEGVTVINYRLMRDGEEIVDFTECTFAEHNSFGADMDPYLLSRKLLNGYFMTLRNKGGNERRTRFDSYMSYIIREWRKSKGGKK